MDASEPKFSNRRGTDLPLTTDLEKAKTEKRSTLSILGATRKSSGSHNQHIYRAAKGLDDLNLSPVLELRSRGAVNDKNLLSN